MSEASLKNVCRQAALVLLAVALGGCGGSRMPDPTDSKKAVSALQGTLEKWKNGTVIDALKKETPAVYASDEDWEAGLKLVAYELRDAAYQGGFSAHIPARLHIQSPNGLWWKEVEYDVTVKDSAVSIIRNDSPE